GYASPKQTMEMKFGKLKKQLKDPSAEFRSAPLWVWNTQVTYEDIDRMLKEFKKTGVWRGICPSTSGNDNRLFVGRLV
ncbi:MAG: hypothetical protein LIO97_06185, partial [Tannerellaceae bacterium]|nr:hypothetical protein [Tannerellaceae bacterium]